MKHVYVKPYVYLQSKLGCDTMQAKIGYNTDWRYHDTKLLEVRLNRVYQRPNAIYHRWGTP